MLKGLEEKTRPPPRLQPPLPPPKRDFRIILRKLTEVPIKTLVVVQSSTATRSQSRPYLISAETKRIFPFALSCNGTSGIRLNSANAGSRSTYGKSQHVSFFCGFRLIQKGGKLGGSFVRVVRRPCRMFKIFRQRRDSFTSRQLRFKPSHERAFVSLSQLPHTRQQFY